MHIGVLQCGHAPDPVQENHGDFYDMFRALFDGHGFTFSNWNVVDMEFPEGPEAADGWLVTGSKHGAYEDHPFIAPLEEFIRAVRDARRRMVGICFGHQIIAQALGGRVEKFSGGWAIGRHEYQGENGAFALNAWHQDQVTALPAGARVTASSDFCENAALIYGDEIYTVQPHPEISPDVLANYIKVKRPEGLFPEEILDQAEAALNEVTHSQQIAAQMAAFLKEGRI